MIFYEWPTDFDYGELGEQPTVVTGSFWTEDGYVQSRVEKVEAHILGEWRDVTKFIVNMESLEADFYDEKVGEYVHFGGDGAA